MTGPIGEATVREAQMVVRELPADLETPVSIYLKLAGDGPSFLFESVIGGEQVSRYSFIGVHPRRACMIQGQKMIVETLNSGRGGASLREEQAFRSFDELHRFIVEVDNQAGSPLPGMPRFTGGLVGYMGYEMVGMIEPTVPLTSFPDSPDAIFLQVDMLVAFDHAANHLVLITRGPDAQLRMVELQEKLDQSLDPGYFVQKRGFTQEKPEQQPSMTRDHYIQVVRKAKEYITAGDIFRAEISQRLSWETNTNAFAIYRALRRLNPSPYMYFIDFSGLESLTAEPIRLIGASPEMHVRLDGNRAVMRPIAGTRPRGNTFQEDLALEAELLADPKERAEHTMLLDLARNDLGRVCRYGSIQVLKQMVVERYSHVMHLVSHVESELWPGLDAFDLLKATFPAGTVSGAPKVRAMQIIHELEGRPRGPYAGIVGYFSYDGSMDTCITIRTLVMQGQQISVQAGAGIVADSNPEQEYQETLNKARALIKAVEMAAD